jgi:hypothetical protein
MLSRAVAAMRIKDSKVFWFFFSKTNIFFRLPVLCPGIASCPTRLEGIF